MISGVKAEPAPLMPVPVLDASIPWWPKVLAAVMAHEMSHVRRRDNQSPRALIIKYEVASIRPNTSQCTSSHSNTLTIDKSGHKMKLSTNGKCGMNINSNNGNGSRSVV